MSTKGLCALSVGLRGLVYMRQEVKVNNPGNPWEGSLSWSLINDILHKPSVGCAQLFADVFGLRIYNCWKRKHKGE